VTFKICQNVFPAGALPQTPLGELTTRPRPPIRLGKGHHCAHCTRRLRRFEGHCPQNCAWPYQHNHLLCCRWYLIVPSVHFLIVTQSPLVRWWHQGHVANPRLVATVKTGRACQPITDAADVTGRDRSWIATRSRCSFPVNLAALLKTSLTYKLLSVPWMTSNLLCLNGANTEFHLLGLKPQWCKFTISNGQSVSSTASACNIGFIFDSCLVLSSLILSLLSLVHASTTFMFFVAYAVFLTLIWLAPLAHLLFTPGLTVAIRCAIVFLNCSSLTFSTSRTLLFMLLLRCPAASVPVYWWRACAMANFRG